MDPIVRAYFLRIVNTLATGLLWMALNSTFGIMEGYAYIEGSIKTGNIVFYIWLAISTILLGIYLYRVWKKPLREEDYE